MTAGIDLDSGELTDVVDARAARERRLGDDQATMNGIAALLAPGEFLLTGKTYRYIRHVRLVAARDRISWRSVRRPSTARRALRYAPRLGSRGSRCARIAAAA